MKTKLLTALIALFLLCGTLVYMELMVPHAIDVTETAAPDAKIYVPFPNVTFHTADEKEISVQTLKEQVVLVHFWAAWCAVCYTEFPELLKYVENSHGKVALLSVSLDNNYAESQKALNKIATKNNLNMQAPNLYWAWDKNKDISLKIFNTVKVPETIIVNDKRQMIDKIIGLGPWHEASAPSPKSYNQQ